MAQLASLLKPAIKTDWFTPEEVLKPVRELAGGFIGLDPCTVASNPTGARFIMFMPKGNGLVQPWGGYGLVFCNPDYGPAAPLWSEKCATEGAKGVEVVALLPARTDTRWFQSHVTTADALCFWAGRITFVGAENAAPFPSVVAYWGDKAKAFRRVFGHHGWIA